MATYPTKENGRYRIDLGGNIAPRNTRVLCYIAEMKQGKFDNAAHHTRAMSRAASAFGSMGEPKGRVDMAQIPLRNDREIFR